MLSPSLLCPVCNYLSSEHRSYRGRLGWWALRCVACGSIWSIWWWLERLTGVRVSRTVYANPSPGAISSAEMLALLVIREAAAEKDEVDR